MSVRVVCVGSAAQDVFLTGKVFTPECEAGVCYEHLKLGDKLSVDDAVFATGGNAMNAAVTFARQDIETSFVGLIGDDPAAQAILNVLDNESVHTEHVVSDSNFKTSYSVILLAPNGERTILNRHGESLSTKAEIVTDKSLKADWLYISSVGSMEVLADIVSRAKKLGTKVA
ncbi:carbohydrate kinase family protein, partial [Candidatus Saccharibacteria bacterium]|nr:carbohydrate kinase family protein [Candidatus Saccharibacteria bacterium]